MFLLLHLEDGAILEGPSDRLRLGRRALDPFALFEGRVKVGKIVQLDEVPHVGEGRLNDGRLDDGCRRGNARSHCSDACDGLLLFVSRCSMNYLVKFGDGRN